MDDALDEQHVSAPVQQLRRDWDSCSLPDYWLHAFSSLALLHANSGQSQALLLRFVEHGTSSAREEIWTSVYIWIMTFLQTNLA